jgi:hypothetical protein
VKSPAELERVPLRELTCRIESRTARHPPRSALPIGSGFGMMAFAGLVSQSLSAAELGQKPKAVVASGGLHHPARAKHVIFLFMNGGLSQVDSFDPKPMLAKYHGQPLPGGTVATERKTGTLMKSPFEFTRYGKSGLEVSELFPKVGACADDICVIRSMQTDIPNHEPSMLMMNTGHIQVGRPSLGIVAHLLGWERQQEPARLRGAVPRRADDRRDRRCGTAPSCPPMQQGTFISSRKTEHPIRSSARTSTPKKLGSYLNNQSFTLPNSGARSIC